MMAKRQDEILQWVRLNDIVLWDDNPNQGDVGAIAEMIREFGFRWPIGLRAGNLTKSGNHRTLALRALHDEIPPKNKDRWQPFGQCLRVADNGEWEIAYIDHSDLTEAQSDAFAVADNRAVRLGHNDLEKLVAILERAHQEPGLRLEATGFDGDDLDDLMRELREPSPAPDAQLDRAQELQEKWQVQRGDLWQIGEHRLLCGDSTIEADVKRLMGDDICEICFTSPPYTDMREYGENSDLSIETLVQFIPVSKDFVNYFCVNLGIKRSHHEIVPYWDDYIKAAKDCGLKFLSWNVWDKLQAGSIANQLAMFPIEHEFIFVFGNVPKEPNRIIDHSPNTAKRREYKRVDEKGRKVDSRRKADGNMRYSTAGREFDKKPLPSIIRNYAELSTSLRQLHPAIMSIGPAAAYLLAITGENDCVYDPFGGSGTTMVACQELNRQCRMMEIEPKYCSVILERLSDMGLKPELMYKVTG